MLYCTEVMSLQLVSLILLSNECWLKYFLLQGTKFHSHVGKYGQSPITSGVRSPSTGTSFSFSSICGLEIKILLLLEYDILSYFVTPICYELHFVQRRWNNLKMVVKTLVVPELSHCTLSTHSSPHCVTLTSLLFFTQRGTTCRCKMISNIAISVLSL